MKDMWTICKVYSNPQVLSSSSFIFFSFLPRYFFFLPSGFSVNLFSLFFVTIYLQVTLTRTSLVSELEPGAMADGTRSDDLKWMEEAIKEILNKISL